MRIPPGAGRLGAWMSLLASPRSARGRMCVAPAAVAFHPAAGARCNRRPGARLSPVGLTATAFRDPAFDRLPPRPGRRFVLKEALLPFARGLTESGLLHPVTNAQGPGGTGVGPQPFAAQLPHLPFVTASGSGPQHRPPTRAGSSSGWAHNPATDHPACSGDGLCGLLTVEPRRTRGFRRNPR